MDNQFTNSITKKLIEIHKEEQRDFLTGEKDLLVPKNEFIDKIMKYENGESYLEVISMENSIFERQGLVHGFSDENWDTYFKIPNWDNFMSGVYAFYIACYADEDEEE